MDHLRLLSSLDGNPENTRLAAVVVLAVVALAVALLYVMTVVSILGAPQITGPAKLLWIVAIVAFPILGPTAWFLVGRRSSLART